jgi:hypothetical protein
MANRFAENGEHGGPAPGKEAVWIVVRTWIAAKGNRIIGNPSSNVYNKFANQRRANSGLLHSSADPLLWPDARATAADSSTVG